MVNLRILPASAFPLALENNLRRLGSRDKVYKHFLTAIRWSFQADSAWFNRRLRHNRSVHEKLVIGDTSLCEESVMEPFARLEHPTIPKNVLLAPFRPHGRVEAVIGVARHDGEFEVGRGRSLNRLATLLAREIERRDEESTCRTLGRIHDKAFSGLPATDLIYRILDGLHQWIRYDHSAALLLYEQSSDTYRVLAEKIVWEKAKSTTIGKETPVTDGLLQKLTLEETVVLNTEGWRLEETHNVSSHLVSAVTNRGRIAGLLGLASSERLPFDAWDRAVVERFLPVTAFCLRRFF
jgi:hypothetical protein